MKRLSIFLALLLTGAVGIVAQTNKDKSKKPPKAKPIPVYLGNEYMDGAMPSSAFGTALAKGLKGKDSSGKTYTVNGFRLTYVERNLYEDAEGNMKVEPDYMMEYCFGDSVIWFLRNNLASRAKAGDTVYFDNITLTSPEGHGAQGKGIKLVLTK
ncbi:MAG: hypothetical protein EOP56_02200 [Sphingobacteriales bacterium]|nr:MAG: hypothetical protein EOP56_02200 [Sphingobacteriales bacterium]